VDSKIKTLILFNLPETTPWLGKYNREQGEATVKVDRCQLPPII
jgi:hypothetical protein